MGHSIQITRVLKGKSQSPNWAFCVISCVTVCAGVCVWVDGDVALCLFGIKLFIEATPVRIRLSLRLQPAVLDTTGFPSYKIR